MSLRRIPREVFSLTAMLLGSAGCTEAVIIAEKGGGQAVSGAAEVSADASTVASSTSGGTGGASGSSTSAFASSGSGGAGGSFCGDQIVSAGEACDNGVMNGKSACSSTCEEQRVLQIANDGGHACAILSGGVVKCWGANNVGQLGLGDLMNRGDMPGEMGDSLPALDLGTGKTAVALSLGNNTSCALLNDGHVKCWGNNMYGVVGQGDTNYRGEYPGEMGDHLPEIDLGAGKTALAVSVGGGFACALLDDHRVKCWGYNAFGALGLGDGSNRGDKPNEMGDNLPAVDLGTGKTAIAVSAGGESVCAVLNDGSVKCWGFNSGNLGLGDGIYRGDKPNQMGDNLPAVDLGTGKKAIAVSAGIISTCALLSDGSVKCWGNNNSGELGLGDNVARGGEPNQMGDNLPSVDLGAGKIATQIRAGGDSTCALLNDGSVKCWGFDMNGELGLGDSIPRGDKPNQMGDSLPAIQFGTGKTVVALSSPATSTCALLNDGSIKCWGLNEVGQLGLGDTSNHGDMPNQMGDNLPTVKLFSSDW